MTIIVFLIDTSASMNQRAYLGGRPTLLDVAKGAVETFVKVRQRSPESRGDRYMLLTFEEPPANIKAGWKENLATFINELKNLQCLGLTTMGAALKHAFDVLNINRMQTGIDTYGQGRCPFYLEPSVIVVITDGGKLSSNAGIQEEFNLPMNCPIPGSELTREPFRWDQRLFSLVLRLAGTPAVERDSGLVPSDTSPIDAMCEVTGGRSYCITSHRMLMQCIDSLVQKVQSGVVINFEKIGPDPPPIDGGTVKDGTEPAEPEVSHGEQEKEIEADNERNGRWNGGPYQSSMTTNQGPSAPQAWHSCRRLIYVPRTVSQKGFAVGFWPIPESFRPDPNAPTLPPRSAHPAVKFTCSSQEPMVIDNLPFDKYELEPSPLTQFILARKQPTTCWQVFVANSGCKNSEVTHPFGYLKASTNLTCVNLFVLPYNYPVLLPLLDDLFKVHRCKPTPEWKLAFQQYLDRMPSYYVTPLRRALAKMGASAPLVQSLIPDTQDNSLSFSVLNYLKRLKNQAKIEFEKLCADVINKASSNNSQKVAESVRVMPRSPLKKDLTTHPCLQDKFSALRDQLNEFGGFVVGLSRGRNKNQAHTYRNPFDIPRRDLLDQVVRMRANFLQPSLAHTRLVDEDSLHSMPVAQMGNYQEYLKRMTPQLREIETQPVRQHMFGNPFKIDKRMMVDEADIDGLGGVRGGGGGGGGAGKRAAEPPRAAPPKRKAGPLPAHFTARRPSDCLSPCPSPCPSPPPAPAPTPPASPAPAPEPVRRPASPLAPVPADLPSGRPPEEPPHLEPGGPGAPVAPSEPPLAPAPQPAPAPAVAAPAVPVAPPNLPPVVKPFLNGDAYTTMGGKLPRSPSPEAPPVVAPAPLHDSQELQINAIIQGIASGTDTLARPRKRPKRKVEKPSPPPAPAQPTRKELADIRKHNLTVRSEVYRAVRRPGRDFAKLFEQLKQLKGSVDVKKELIRGVINESLRFKRKALAKLLEDFLAGLEKNGNSASLNMKRLTNSVYSNSTNNYS
ncbi:LOW QUALITY PROTEIN: integrator complex subunit 6 [Leguminivora glycinivorella]|uniref:LOW QUALITY PROTEIN: integrator complex subunit 6 n=1 Tax=Leguminivora glycinivorella TaxID=1035111 RepID=UPI0020100DAC|nr:LOW QUALITY PROTEIN: integrator complex subunit 6 [Leguminivora glycinivorella]